ncbi:hypothetical protein NIES4071_108130 (plasmid) [Calothrix sp. NIES-4071]|nr:hypothetical protein NIES4071_108130 [Calothrix sp. NIES-4071]BAZ64853.1 hypothetical protein NIES4105_105860 [Calothrix sp. NIES-4105]
MHKILKSSYEEVAPDAMVEGEDYVGATQHHFFGLKKTASNKYQTSEKNGASAVYHRRLDQKEFNKLINDTYASPVKIYKEI